MLAESFFRTDDEVRLAILDNLARMISEDKLLSTAVLRWISEVKRLDRKIKEGNDARIGRIVGGTRRLG